MPRRECVPGRSPAVLRKRGLPSEHSVVVVEAQALPAKLDQATQSHPDVGLNHAISARDDAEGTRDGLTRHME